MRRLFLAVLLNVVLMSAYGFAQMEGGMMGSGGEKQYSDTPYRGYSPCPQMMGPGMMGMMGPGMMGPGMMGPGMGYGWGRGMWGYNPDEYKKYMDETAGLRKKLHEKYFDYFEAVRNPDTKRDDIMKLEKEMRDLQEKIYEKAPR